jgi:uncharacterized phiE125 gp8 family phage protein
MAMVVATKPTIEPVTLAEARAHLRVDLVDDDGLIEGLIRTVREYVEVHVLRRALLTQTWDMYLDAWPESDRVDVPLPPLQSVSWVKYTDDTGAISTLASGSYLVDTVREPGRVVLKSGYTWPATTLQVVNGVNIRFVCGWSAAADVPKPIKQAILLMVGDLYENRENTLIGQGLTIKELPLAVQALLMPYRVYTWV